MKCIRLLAMQVVGDGRPRHSGNIQLFGAPVEPLRSSKRAGVSWRAIYLIELMTELRDAHFGSVEITAVQLHCGVPSPTDESTVAPYDIRDPTERATSSQYCNFCGNVD